MFQRPSYNITRPQFCRVVESILTSRTGKDGDWIEKSVIKDHTEAASKRDNRSMAHYDPKDRMKRHVRAFIYLSTSLGKESQVADALWQMEEVKEVHIIPGQHDIVAVVDVPRHFLEPDPQSIYWFMLDRIKGIPDIVNTDTLIPILSMSKWSN